MSFITNLPRHPRPRGLGELGAAASGFGTWVVDQHWGLSPAIIPGQPRPYGTSIVQTKYPRTDLPRMLNTSYKVIPTPSGPVTDSSQGPVFRTPLAQAGVKVTSDPGAAKFAQNMAGSAGGYGWIQMGVAQPPFDMLERAYQDPHYAGFGSFGQNTMEVAGNTIEIPDDIKAFVTNNPSESQLLFQTWARTYANLKVLWAMWQSRRDKETSILGLHPDRAADVADGAVFGSNAKRREMHTLMQTFDKARAALQQNLTAGDFAQLPPDWKRTLDRFLNPGDRIEALQQDTIFSQGHGFGVVFTTAGLIVIAVISAIIGGVGITITVLMTQAERNAAETTVLLAQAQKNNVADNAKTLEILRVRMQTATGSDLTKLSQQYNQIQQMDRAETSKIKGMLANLDLGGGGTAAAVMMIGVVGVIALVIWKGAKLFKGGGNGKGGGGKSDVAEDYLADLPRAGSWEADQAAARAMSVAAGTAS